MSGKYNNFGYYFDNLKNNLNEILRNKNYFKQIFSEFILSFQMMDSRIQKALFFSHEFYLNQRNYYKQKIKNSKKKKLENEQLWTRLTNDVKNTKTPKLDNSITEEISFLEQSIKDIKFKISNLNYQLERQTLDIDAENSIIEELVILQDEKKIKTNELSKLENKQEQKFQSSKYYHMNKKIKNLELSLTKNYDNIKKWSDRLLYSHKKMFNLLRIAREFDILKSKITSVFSDNKDVFIYYNQLYLDVIDENYKTLLEELKHLKQLNKIKKQKILKEKEKVTPDTKQHRKQKSITKKRKYTKKLKEEKLALALKKQKSGKKLDFYELKLILDHSKRSK